jgi:hypothetical protein
MATASLSSKSVVLNSWKEIAAYLGRGVRTVQRYERELGLPVRRPRGTPRSAVLALTDELDNWLRTAPTGELHRQTEPPSAAAQVQALFTRDKKTVQKALGERSHLLQRCTDLRAAHREAVAKLINNLNVMVQEINSFSRVRTTKTADTQGER